MALEQQRKGVVVACSHTRKQEIVRQGEHVGLLSV
jgi:hypothetical protein